MAAKHIVDPLDVCGICTTRLSSVSQVQYIYINEEPGAVSILVVVPSKDYSVERSLYDAQLKIIEACPNLKFNMRVFSLRGRKLLEAIVPKGRLMFVRDEIANARRAS